MQVAALLLGAGKLQQGAVALPGLAMGPLARGLCC